MIKKDNVENNLGKPVKLELCGKIFKGRIDRVSYHTSDNGMRVAEIGMVFPSLEKYSIGTGSAIFDAKLNLWKTGEQIKEWKPSASFFSIAFEVECKTKQ